MGIYIKGISMPKENEIVYIFPDGTAQKSMRGEFGKAVEIPAHGRLIDIDAFVKYVCWSRCGCGYEGCRYIDAFGAQGCEAIRLIRNAPAVIEAEDGEL